MPYLSQSETISFAESVYAASDETASKDDVIKDVLNGTPAYYASNRSEVREWVGEWYSEEIVAPYNPLVEAPHTINPFAA